jgi:glutathione S-transferase
MLKLYGIPGSRAFRNLWMLEELGVPYENVPTHFANGDTKKPEYLKLNPNGHIPTLVDDGVAYWESMAINLHLARKYDKGLQPTTLVGVDLSGFPNLSRWLGECSARPAAKKAMALAMGQA